MQEIKSRTQISLQKYFVIPDVCLIVVT